jgi:hypothetical protein
MTHDSTWLILNQCNGALQPWQCSNSATQSLTGPQLVVFSGLGDCLGVFFGHLGFKAAMKARGQDVDMKQEVQTAAHLGSAAALSGFTWQPTLNSLQALECGFNECMLGVGGACTLAFYIGLRVFRKLYGGILKWDHVEESNYKNLKADVVSYQFCVPVRLRSV